MKNKEIIFYDNTDTTRKFNGVREFLFDNLKDENGWNSVDDVPEESIWEEIDFQEEIAWNDLKYDLTKAMKDKHYLLTGTFGSWQGDKDGGNFVSSFSDLIRNIEHLDYLKIYEQNGHLYIIGHHHDGSDRYELKQLTKKGLEYARSWGFAHDRQLHSNIKNCNLFSKLPRFSQVI